MGEEERSFRIAGPMTWILTITLMIWNECGNAQGQGNLNHDVKYSFSFLYLASSALALLYHGWDAKKGGSWSGIGEGGAPLPQS